MLGDYLTAVIWRWVGAAFVALAFAQLVAVGFPSTKSFIDRHQGNMRVLRVFTLVLFVWANFGVSQQDQQEILALRINPAAIDLRTLPKSQNGLRPGDLWDDGGVLVVTH
jgi:hypothetical protein